jgi:response regulator RpfG family c-di-GMP phosphodiesterase
MVTGDDEEQKLKNDIISAITAVEAADQRVVLSLMLRMVNTNERLAEELVEKLDLILEDEKRLKSIVLNGHMDEHDEHHRWLSAHIKAHNEISSNHKMIQQKVIQQLVSATAMFVAGIIAAKLFPHLF